MSLSGLISCSLPRLERHQAPTNFPGYKHIFTPYSTLSQRSSSSQSPNPPMKQHSVGTVLPMRVKKRLSIHRQRWDICTYVFAWSEPPKNPFANAMHFSSKPFGLMTEVPCLSVGPCVGYPVRFSYRTHSYSLLLIFHHLSVIYSRGYSIYWARGENNLFFFVSGPFLLMLLPSVRRKRT